MYSNSIQLSTKCMLLLLYVVSIVLKGQGPEAPFFANPLASGEANVTTGYVEVNDISGL